MTLGKEIPVRDFNKWLKALYSEMYAQAEGELQNEKGYCCLGVACDLFIPKKKQILYGGVLSGSFPESRQKNAPLWLKEINRDFASKMKEGLDDLNDTQKLTFPEIAMCLELVYVHKALD